MQRQLILKLIGCAGSVNVLSTNVNVINLEWRRKDKISFQVPIKHTHGRYHVNSMYDFW